MLLKKFKTKNSGNVSFLVLSLVIVFSVLFIIIFDICNIFVAREKTKKASDAASLAVAQNLLFFENTDRCKIAEEVTRLNDCSLVECICSYDEVVVAVEKRVQLVLLDKLIKNYSVATSTSSAEVIYPWDEQSGYCDFYRFGY